MSSSQKPTTPLSYTRDQKESQSRDGASTGQEESSENEARSRNRNRNRNRKKGHSAGQDQSKHSQDFRAGLLAEFDEDKMRRDAIFTKQLDDVYKSTLKNRADQAKVHSSRKRKAPLLEHRKQCAPCQKMNIKCLPQIRYARSLIVHFLGF